MRSKENYHEKLDLQLEELDSRIDLLAIELKRQKPDARVDYGEQIKKLRQKHAALHKKVAELKQTSGKAWVALKNIVVKGALELEASLNKMLLRYM